jgi:hypothetical protein
MRFNRPCFLFWVLFHFSPSGPFFNDSKTERLSYRPYFQRLMKVHGIWDAFSLRGFGHWQGKIIAE